MLHFLSNDSEHIGVNQYLCKLVVAANDSNDKITKTEAYFSRKQSLEEDKP